MISISSFKYVNAFLIFYTYYYIDADSAGKLFSAKNCPSQTHIRSTGSLKRGDVKHFEPLQRVQIDEDLDPGPGRDQR